VRQQRHVARRIACAWLCLGLALPAAVAARAEELRRLRESLTQAEAALRQGRPERAEQLYLEALAAAERDGRPTLLLAQALDGLADVRREGEAWASAEPLYRRSAELLESLLGGRQPRLATTLHNLGVVVLAQGRPAEAAPLFERALSIWDSAFGPDSEPARNTRRALAGLEPRGDPRR
jgi:tetratricopeptide (TPR) repeat protein